MTSDVSGVDGRPTLATSSSHGAKKPEVKPVSAQTSPPTGTDRDSVQITDTAAQLRRLEAALENQPIVDRAKVETLRAAIAEGRYQIDTNEVAQKFIDIKSAIEKD